MKLKEAMAEYQTLIDKARKSGNPAAAIAELNAQATQANPEKFKDMFTDTDAQLSAASALIAGVGESGTTLSELQVLVAEMRLVLPNEVVHTAELVSSYTYTLAQISSALPGMARLALGGIVTGALNVYVNAVRHEVGLNYYEPKNVTDQEMEKALQEIAAKQTNAARA